jgi:hypothetical protein
MQNDINRDDFLGKLIQEIELDCPSDNFVDNIMSQCYAEQVVIKSKFRLAIPWVSASLIFIILFSLVFIFGGPILGGSLYGIFSGSLGTIGSVALKVLATMKLTYIGLGLAGISGIILIINKIKQKLAMRIV